MYKKIYIFSQKKRVSKMFALIVNQIIVINFAP